MSCFVGGSGRENLMFFSRQKSPRCLPGNGEPWEVVLTTPQGRSTDILAGKKILNKNFYVPETVE
jgi:hypothetical protein